MHFDPEKMKVIVTTNLPVGGGFPLIKELSDFNDGNSIVPKQANDSAKIKYGKKTYITSSIESKQYTIDLDMLSWALDSEYLSLLEKLSARFRIVITYGPKVMVDFKDCMIQKMSDGAGLGDGTDTGSVTYTALVGGGFYHLVSADA